MKKVTLRVAIVIIANVIITSHVCACDILWQTYTLTYNHFKTIFQLYCVSVIVTLQQLQCAAKK